MILADTSVWIEFLKQTHGANNQKFSDSLDVGNIVAISVVFGELLLGVRDEREEKVILEYWRFLPKIDEKDLFIAAGKLSSQYKLFNKGVGLVDCCILAAAKVNKLEIWSLDKKLLQANHLIY